MTIAGNNLVYCLFFSHSVYFQVFVIIKHMPLDLLCIITLCYFSAFICHVFVCEFKVVRF